MKKRKVHKKMMDQEKDTEVKQEEAETVLDDGAVDADETPAADSKLLDALKAKADEYLNMAQRVQADFDNFRRRNESARADSFQDGQRNVATAMLPVLDNLERAIEAAKDTPDDDPLKSGVALTLRQLNEAMKKLGVEVIDRQGEQFDPNLENAVMQGSSDEGEPGSVCAVFQKGYTMNGKVLRHAMVKVVPED